MQQSMEAYTSALNAQGVVDLSSLAKFDASDLSSLGITKGKERRRVQACIAKFKESINGPANAQTSDLGGSKPSDAQEPPRSKSKRNVVIATPAEIKASSIAAGESTESDTAEITPNADPLPVSRNLGRSQPMVPSPSLPLAKSEESASEHDPVPVPSTPTDTREDKMGISAPHLFHTDDTSNIDGTKEYGRSEEDTEIRSSNSVDREHQRRHEIGDPEPIDAHAGRSTRKSRRALHAPGAPPAANATAANDAKPTDSPAPAAASSASLAPLPTSSSSLAVTNNHASSSNAGTANPGNNPLNSSGISSTSKATSLKSSNVELAAPSATTTNSGSKLLEGQLQVKKGGFFRLTKKWEPRWCTFEGKIFQAFKTKDDKVPIMHIDITKAIITGSNDRNLKVLEMTAQGKRSHWTGPNIEIWIKAMRSMSITSLNAKRRTADYGEMRDIDGPNSATSGSTQPTQNNGGMEFDSSEEAYQSLDVATEEEDRPFRDERKATSSRHNSPDLADNRRPGTRKRKSRKAVADSQGNANGNIQPDGTAPSAPQPSSSNAKDTSFVVVEVPHVVTHASTGKSKSKSSINFHVHTTSTDSTSFATSPSNISIPAKESSAAEGGLANGHSSAALAVPSLPALSPEQLSIVSAEGNGSTSAHSTAQKSPSRTKREGGGVPPSLSNEDVPRPVGSPNTSNTRRSHHRPRVPKKTSSVGNMKTAKLSDELFQPSANHQQGQQNNGRSLHHSKPGFSKKSRVAFDDIPCKEAVARYASQQKAQRESSSSSHGSSASPRSSPNSPYSLVEEESEFEDPYYEDDNLLFNVEGSKDGMEDHGANHPPHLKKPSLGASFQVVVPRTASDYKNRWVQRYCTFDGVWLRSYATANDAKLSNSVCSSFDMLHSKVTPIYISRVMCLEIFEEESGKRELWRGAEVANWLPHLERFAGRGYDPILGGLLVRQCHRDESQWIARYCTFNGHQFQSFRFQSDLVPIWTSHIRHLSTRSVKLGGGVELMELMLDGGAQSLWWTPPKTLVSNLVRPLPALKRFTFTTGSVATTSGGDTPTLASVLRGTAPLEAPEDRNSNSVRDSVNGREDDEDEWCLAKDRMADWIGIIREAHEICIGDSERYIADEWDLESDDEDASRKPASRSYSAASAEGAPTMKGMLSYRVAKKNWEPRYVELIGRHLLVFKKKHDKKAEFNLKITKCKTILKKSNDVKHPETLEITLDDYTHVFREKTLSMWYDAIVNTANHFGSAHPSQLNTTPLSLPAIDPNELSAAESRSESVLTSSRWGALEESEEGSTDDSRSEGIRRVPEEQPRTASVPLLNSQSRKDLTAASSSTTAFAGTASGHISPHTTDFTSAGERTPPSREKRVNSHDGTSPIGHHANHGGANRTKNDHHTSAFSVGLSNSLLNQSAADVTTDDSSSGPHPAVPAAMPKATKFKSPSAAVDSVKSHSHEIMHHPTSYYSDADDNQFAPTVENMPKPAWTGAIARYRPNHKDWVGRYIIFRPGTDILVYLSKPASIESVPPLATIFVASIATIVLSSVDDHQVLEITESSAKKHIWFTSDAHALLEIMETSSLPKRSKKRSSKSQAPLSAVPAVSKRAHKLSNMSGSSPALDLSGRQTPDRDKERSKAPSKNSNTDNKS